MRFSCRSILLCTAVVAWRACLAPPSCEATENVALEAALLSIRSGDLRGHVDVLADDTLEGREAGSRGGRAASGYLAAHLQKLGLKPGGDQNGYFQGFDNKRNVLAVLPGSDPELSKEFVVLGAHYDHVGYGTARNSFGPTGFIHNGADDNASGTSTLLELADAFASLPTAPKRSILFAFWDGEEQGLLGSKHWTASPTVPRQQIAFAFNIDMLGRLRNDKIEVYGSRTSVGLRRLVSRHNQRVGLELDFTWEMTANSDHYSFVSHDIPVLMPFTGLHEDYHRPSDDVEKINTQGMERVARLTFLVAHEIADSARRHAFRSLAKRETPVLRQQFERPSPPPPPRLGVSWKPGEPTNGLELARVEPGSAAAVAGLRTGDRLIDFQGRPIVDEKQFRMQLLAAQGDVAFGVKRSSSDERVEVVARLPGTPVRVGIAWREDDAEPGAVLITQVVPGSAAQLAGLRERDVIYEVDGQLFADGDDFGRRITTRPSPLSLLVDRAGRLSTLTLDLPPPVAAMD